MREKIVLFIGLTALVLSVSLMTFINPVFAQDFFGKINAPTSGFGSDPGRDVGSLIGVGIRTTFVVAGVTCLMFMLWGALGWITSGGEQEKLQKAQMRIRNAVIGMFMVVIMFGLFVVIFGLVLNNKIIDVRNGFEFKIPTIKGNRCDLVGPGVPCTP